MLLVYKNQLLLHSSQNTLLCSVFQSPRSYRANHSQLNNDLKTAQLITPQLIYISRTPVRLPDRQVDSWISQTL